MTRELLLEHICPTDYTDVCVLVGCENCEVKLNEWLDDYDKHVIEQYKASTNLKDTIKDIHDNVAREMYCKGIDEFADKLNAKCNGMIKEKWNSNVAPISWAEAYADFKDDIEEIAEELKAGGNNE